MVHSLDKMHFVLQDFFEGREINPFDLVPLYNFDGIKSVVLQRLG
jgi:hypothetical protein